MEVKMKGMGSEKYVRVGSACPCRSDNVTCNFCKFVPKDWSKHEHRLFIRTKRTVKQFLRKSHIEFDLMCPCGFKIRGKQWK